MTFDEATESINALSAFSTVYGISPTVYGISPTVVRDIISKLKEEYAPTVEMTQAQYDIFNSALAASKEGENDFIYFIENLDTQSHFYGDIFGKELSVFINDSRYLMQAWLHPETIKVVDDDVS